MTVHTLTTKIKNRHGLNIAVRVEVPESPKGLLFIVHGWSSSMQGSSARWFSDASRDINLTTILFDCTHSTGDSDGSLEHSTITTFISDFEDVMAWSKTQDWYHGPVILAGSSLGGITILEYAHANPQDVFALAPVATVISGQYSIEAHNRRDPVELEAWKSRGVKTHTHHQKGDFLVPWSHMEDRLNYNVLDYAADLTQPLFMCVGTEDTSCPPDHQKHLFEAWGGQDKELHSIEGAPHTIADPAHGEVLKTRFAAWVTRVLG